LFRYRRSGSALADRWLRLPGRIPGDEGIGNGDELSGAGDGGDGVVLAGITQPPVSRLEQWVPVLCCGKSGQEDGAAETASTAGDVPLSCLLATISVEGCDADQGGGLGAGEAAEFGHADDEGHGGDFADAWDADQDVETTGEVGCGTEQADEASQLLGAALGQALDFRLEKAQRCSVAIAFEPGLETGDVLGELLNQREVLGEWCQTRIGGLAREVDGGRDLGNQRSVDRIGLGPTLLEAAPAMDLTRVEDEHHEVALAQVLSDGGLVVAGGFETDALYAEGVQAFGDDGVTGGVIGDGEALEAAGNGHIEFAFGDIDTRGEAGGGSI